MATKITQIKKQIKRQQTSGILCLFIKNQLSLQLGYELNKKKKQWQWKLKPYRP